jgi:DNA-binding SARP family transcriptional activator/ABC-type branched-subunit amino acid transport system substrate-binding protein
VAAALDFRLLGPLEVARDGALLDVGGTRRRSVLAILLLHRGEVVSVDRLVDGLWGDEPPESAVTVVQGHVSRLRRLLGDDASGAIETKGHGYVMEVDPQALDVARCETLLELGRGALAEGRPDAAAAALDEARALWRGPALADLVDEPFAAEHLPGLRELHVAVIEEQAEADLTRGREPSVMAALRRIVRDDPLRERSRALLMLALHRAGRDAEALASYDEARRVLSDELGIAPGASLRELHERILRQDPSLRAPARQAAASRRRRSRRAATIALVCVALAGAAGLGIVIAGGSDDGEPASAPAPISGDVLVAIDTASSRVVDRVRAGGSPSSLAADEGVVWTLNADDQTLTVVESGGHVARTVGTGATPIDLAVGDGSLWVTSGARRKDALFVGPVAGSVDQLDARTGAVRRTTPLPRPVGPILNAGARRLAVAPGAVWAVGADGAVVHIDPGSGEIVAVVRSVRATALVASSDTAWALTVDHALVPISVRTNRVGVPIDVSVAEVGSLAVGGGALWVTDPAAGLLWRIQPGVEVRRRAIRVGAGAGAVAFGDDAVWVANGLAGAVMRIDPTSGRIEERIAIDGIPRDLAIDGRLLWVGVAKGSGTAGALLTGPVPGATCGPTFYAGPGRPDAIVVSDFPLRAAPRAPTLQMAEAIALALRRHDFRAGRLRVGLRSCDDSTAQAAIFDPRRCEANARAFAADRSIVAVIGPYNSGCARVQLDTYARAAGGPMPIVSPTATAIDLTSGRRPFASLASRDDAQAAAAALFMQRAGKRRVFVLHDGEPGYGQMMAFELLRAARRAGLTVVGTARWRPGAKSFRALARRVRGARPDAVYLGGLIDTDGGAVLRALRRELPPRTALVAPDGFLPVATLRLRAGSAARGVHITLPGLTVAGLPPAGRRFARELAAAASRATVQPASIYAAQATDLVLAALARSDGTRASVQRALSRVSLPDGLLGDVRLTATGRAAAMPVTVVRVADGRGSDALESTEGAEVEDVIAPQPALLRKP